MLRTWKVGLNSNLSDKEGGLFCLFVMLRSLKPCCLLSHIQYHRKAFMTRAKLRWFHNVQTNVMQDYEILNNFIIENSTKLQKLVLEGEISWVMSSHFNQEHMPHQFLIIHEHGKIQKKGTMARRLFQLLWVFLGAQNPN